MSDCPLVLIKWEDSRQPAPAWTYVRNLSAQYRPVICVSVGWLVQDTNECKVLCQNFGDMESENAQASGVMVIPTRCVISVERLVEKDEDEAIAA